MLSTKVPRDAAVSAPSERYTSMKVPSILHVSDFWQRVCTSKVQFLALDYDGTLAPFRTDRDAARPLPGVPEILDGIATRHSMRVAIVSGRPIAEIVRLLGDLPVTMIGSHGFELREIDGALHQIALDPDQLSLLRSEIAQLHDDDESIFHDNRVEDKRSSIAVHTRGMAEDAAQEVEKRIYDRWNALASSEKLVCRRFNGGVELRALGVDKGSALERWLGPTPADANAQLEVYIGDDDTDEDAFRLLQERKGVGIKVGLAGKTSAHGRVADCAEVKKLLQHWHDLLSSTQEN